MRAEANEALTFFCSAATPLSKRAYTCLKQSASCQQHDLEPRRYLLEVFCLLPVWPSENLLALSPLKWKETRALPHVEEMLQRNPYWCAATEAELAAGDRW